MLDVAGTDHLDPSADVHLQPAVTVDAPRLAHDRRACGGRDRHLAAERRACRAVGGGQAARLGITADIGPLGRPRVDPGQDRSEQLGAVDLAGAGQFQRRRGRDGQLVARRRHVQADADHDRRAAGLRQDAGELLLGRAVEQVVGPLERDLEAGHPPDRVVQRDPGEQRQPAPRRNRRGRPEHDRERQPGPRRRLPAAVEPASSRRPGARRRARLRSGRRLVVHQVGIGRLGLARRHRCEPTARRARSGGRPRRSAGAPHIHVTCAERRDRSPWNMGASRPN